MAGIHGGLLCATQLAIHCPAPVKAQFEDLCARMVPHLTHKELCVRIAAMELAGELSVLEPHAFGLRWLAPTANAVIRLSRSREDRSVALSALGRIAEGIGADNMSDSVFEEMLVAAHSGLFEYKRSLHKAVPASVPEALRAISQLAENTGPRITPENADKLAEAMIGTGLSTDLTQVCVCPSLQTSATASLAALLHASADTASSTNIPTSAYSSAAPLLCTDSGTYSSAHTDITAATALALSCCGGQALLHLASASCMPARSGGSAASIEAALGKQISLQLEPDENAGGPQDLTAVSNALQVLLACALMCLIPAGCRRLLRSSGGRGLSWRGWQNIICAQAMR